MATPSAPRPSSGWGLRQARRLWRLVIACWVVSVVVWLPALWVVGDTAATAVGSLPDDTSALPAGEAVLILYLALRGVMTPVKLAVVSGLVTLWIWTVLWHAGMVGWQLWAGGRRVRIGEVLGLGVVSWWRYARLSLTAASVMLIWCLVLGIQVEEAVWALSQEMNEDRTAPLVGAAVVVSLIFGWIVWAATVRAAWLLGHPERRSAVLAWLRGLGGTLRAPLVSLGTVAVWALPAVLVSVVPLAVGFLLPAARGGWMIPILGQVAALTRAFCWVGLFASFAPVTGFVGVGEEEEDPVSNSKELARSAREAGTARQTATSIHSR